MAYSEAMAVFETNATMGTVSADVHGTGQQLLGQLTEKSRRVAEGASLQFVDDGPLSIDEWYRTLDGEEVVTKIVQANVGMKTCKLFGVSEADGVVRAVDGYRTDEIPGDFHLRVTRLGIVKALLSGVGAPNVLTGSLTEQPHRRVANLENKGQQVLSGIVRGLRDGFEAVEFILAGEDPIEVLEALGKDLR